MIEKINFFMLLTTIYASEVENWNLQESIWVANNERTWSKYYDQIPKCKVGKCRYSYCYNSFDGTCVCLEQIYYHGKPYRYEIACFFDCLTEDCNYRNCIYIKCATPNDVCAMNAIPSGTRNAEKCSCPRGVQIPPGVDCAPPQIDTLIEIDKVILNCSYEVPIRVVNEFDVTWKRLVRSETNNANEEAIKHGTKSGKFQMIYRTLIVNKTTSKDQGKYTCEITRTSFNKSSTTIELLEIYDADKTFLNYSHQINRNELTVNAGENVQFHITVNSMPECPTILCIVGTGNSLFDKISVSFYNNRCKPKSAISNSTLRYFLLRYDLEGKLIPQHFLSNDNNVSSSINEYRVLNILNLTNIEKHYFSHNESFIKTSENTTLKIANVTLSDFGTYTMKAFHLYKSVSVDFKLVVNDKPAIIKWKKNTECMYKEICHFECAATGYPLPQVSWSINSSGTFQNISISETGEITLNPYQIKSTYNFTPSESGVLLCRVENSMGNDEFSMEYLVITGNKYEAEGTLPSKFEIKTILIIILLIILLILSLIWPVMKLRMKMIQKEKLRKIVSNFEDGVIDEINSKLDFEEQAYLLPFHRKWQFPSEKLNLGKIIGFGGFGFIRRAIADGIIEKNTSTVVATKIIESTADLSHFTTLVCELKLMSNLGKHLNIVNLLGACTECISKRKFSILLEYCRYGNLRDFLSSQQNKVINQINESGEIDFSITHKPFCFDECIMEGEYYRRTISKNLNARIIKEFSKLDWSSYYCGEYRTSSITSVTTSDLVYWSFQIARGMQYLSNRKIIHSDLMLKNVLLAEGNVVKICNFGFAKIIHRDEKLKQKNASQFRWMAIETLENTEFSVFADIWSFGVTIWELFSISVVPYEDIENADSLCEKLMTGYRLEKPEYATEQIYAVMRECWYARKILRPSFAELSDRLGRFLENNIRSHYKGLSEQYNEESNFIRDLKASVHRRYLVNPTNIDTSYRNIDPIESGNNVEMKPILEIRKKDRSN